MLIEKINSIIKYISNIIGSTNITLTTAINTLYNNKKDKGTSSSKITHIIECINDPTYITIPDGVTKIRDYAFYSHKKIKSITIPNSVITIGDEAFAYCYGLSKLIFPDSVNSIGKSLCYKCSNLTEVQIGQSITEIKSNAFYYCSRLTNISIGNNVSSIGRQAFVSCSKLSNITLPESVTLIDDFAFYNCNRLKTIKIENINCQLFDSQNIIPSTTTIYGYKGSTAESYAKKYNRTFVSLD